ncbi:MAG: hypothetical protein ACLGI6_03100 [Gammaproteobacteria bacterium]
MLKSLNIALLASALLMAAGVSAQAQPQKAPSFKSGFSSQRSSSPPPSKPSFGSFGSRQSSAPPPAPPPAPSRASGSFGSFGNSPASTPRKSDSALSEKLNRSASQDRALRTLDERRAAQAESRRDTRPVPGYENGNRPDAMPAPQPQPTPAPSQPPVIVRNDNSQLASVVTGFVLAKVAGGAHATTNNGYPGQVGSGGVNHGSAAGPGGSVFGLFVWLVLLSAVGWAIWFAVKRMRAGREKNKPHYSFERN